MCSTFLCWLWPLIAGILCGILGYLLGRSMSSKWRGKYEDLKRKYEQLKLDFDKCKKHRAELESELSGLKAQLEDCKRNKVKTNNFVNEPAKVAVIPFNADAAKAVFGKKIKQDDLKVVEGIGPKIEELFHNAGVKTWKALSETSVERCQEILDSAGERFKVHTPRTWPEQAKMAYEGKWKELLKWQDELDGGK